MPIVFTPRDDDEQRSDSLLGRLIDAGLVLGGTELLSGDTDIGFRQSSRPLLRSFQSPFFTGSLDRDTKTLSIAPTERLDTTLADLRGVGEQATGDLNDLLARVRPGFSELRRAREQAIGNVFSQRRGDLRADLAQRRILGSSFGQNARARLATEEAQQLQQARAKSIAEELDLTSRIIEQRTQAARNAILPELEALTNLGKIEAGLIHSAQQALSANARTLEELAGQAASGIGSFLEDTFGGSGGGLLEAIFGEDGSVLDILEAGTGFADDIGELFGIDLSGDEEDLIGDALEELGIDLGFSEAGAGAAAGAGTAIEAGTGALADAVEAGTGLVADLGEQAAGAAGSTGAELGAEAAGIGAGATTLPLIGEVAPLLGSQSLGLALASIMNPAFWGPGMILSGIVGSFLEPDKPTANIRFTGEPGNLQPQVLFENFDDASKKVLRELAGRLAEQMNAQGIAPTTDVIFRPGTGFAVRGPGFESRTEGDVPILREPVLAEVKEPDPAKLLELFQTNVPTEEEAAKAAGLVLNPQWQPTGPASELRKWIKPTVDQGSKK